MIAKARGGRMSRFVAVASLMFSFGILIEEVAFAQTQTPIQAMWAGIKRNLTGPDGQQYFRDTLNESVLPTLEGSLISATPPDHPIVVVLGISDPNMPEITLRFRDGQGKEAHLNGPLMRGSQIRFEGIVKAFTRDPFMLTFDVSTEFKKPVQRRR
jgi:hypothetical protein